LVEGLQEVTYAGTVTPEGGPACHALELVYADYDATLWVEQGDTPLPMRLALDLTRAYAKAGAAQEVHVALDFSDWELNPTFEAGRFTFEIPSDATEMRMTAQEQARNPQLALIGEPAPAIDATLLGGAPFSLADHKDQDIVILEFWATWCGPCRMAMPAVAEVANAYADKGVVLYAVNIKEPEAKVQAFIDNMNYGHPVVLDPQGRAGAAYKASNIPQTVIVGKDGTVQAVHRGFSPYLRKQLSEELDTLLAGKSLVE
jgi:thiol-disulfide isomerase/thioredoxin